MENQEKLLFLALNLLIHFRKSPYRISRESLLLEKLFGKAPIGFKRELARRALPLCVNCQAWRKIRRGLVMLRLQLAVAQDGHWREPRGKESRNPEPEVVLRLIMITTIMIRIRSSRGRANFGLVGGACFAVTPTYMGRGWACSRNLRAMTGKSPPTT